MSIVVAAASWHRNMAPHLALEQFVAMPATVT
jgi:hypothetical protein